MRECFMADFEVGSDTVLIMSKEGKTTEIVNSDNVKYKLPISSRKLLDNTCKMFGSSLLGRIESSKKWLGYDYKLPIMIDEIRNLVFFPTRSIDSNENIWISYNLIDEYKKIPSGVELLLTNGNTMIISESFSVFENQYIRAFKLHRRIEKIRASILN